MLALLRIPARVLLGKTVKFLSMERVAHKSRSAREAAVWERAQYKEMTLAERVRVARALKRRAYPPPQPDVREWHRRR